MTSFTNANKISGIYRSSDKISNFKFQVKIKEINTVIPLPNFETFASQENHPEKKFSSYYEEKEFSWQEKVLGPAEMYLYADLQNCKSETEIKYNAEIVQNDLKPATHNRKIFSYTNNDNYNYDHRLTTDFQNIMEHVNKKLEKVNLVENVDDVKSVFRDTTVKETKGDDVPNVDEDKMFIVFDMNNPESDPTYLLRREYVLFTLTWNPEERCLTVFPDFNDINLNPYLLETSFYSKQIFHYSIEHLVNDVLDDAKVAEIQLLDKIELSRKQIYSSKIFRNFILPPKNVLKCLYIIEIVSAYGFEYPNLYVEYTIELPFGFVSPNPLCGVTQIADVNKKRNVAHFGHVFEFCVNYQMGISSSNEEIPEEPEIIFEVISCDCWDRHRTEGYCYTKLPTTQPGKHRVTLKASRPQGENTRVWEMNRYFIGGRNVLTDLSWLSAPSTSESKKLNKFGIKTVSTGELQLRMNVILQSQNFSQQQNTRSEDHQVRQPGTLVERLTADSLFKSVNTVLQAYKNAKEKLASCQNVHYSS